MEMVERIAGTLVSEEGPPVTAAPIYANYVNAQASAHDLVMDFYHQLPGSTRSGEARKVLVSHVARMVLPLTMLKDFRRVIDTQIAGTERLLGQPLPVVSELQAAKRAAEGSGTPSSRPAAASGGARRAARKKGAGRE